MDKPLGVQLLLQGNNLPATANLGYLLWSPIGLSQQLLNQIGFVPLLETLIVVDNKPAKALVGYSPCFDRVNCLWTMHAIIGDDGLEITDIYTLHGEVTLC